MISQGMVERDAGIARAINHANAVAPKWSDRAYNVLLRYLEEKEFFTSEQVREFAGDSVEPPPDLRAWGGVIQRGARAGLIVEHGWTTAQAANVHCCPKRVWRSTTFRS